MWWKYMGGRVVRLYMMIQLKNARGSGIVLLSSSYEITRVQNEKRPHYRFIADECHHTGHYSNYTDVIRTTHSNP